MLHKLIAKLIAAVGATALLTVSSAQAETVSSNLRQELRQAVTTYIDAHSTDGKFLLRSPASGRTLAYGLSEAYTLVVKVGEKFVICSSFQTPEGKTTYVDFLIHRDNGMAQVVNVFAGRRSATRKMVEAQKLAESAIAELQ